MTNEIKAAVESLEFDVAYQGQLYYLLPDYKTRIKFVCQALRAAEQGRRQVEQECKVKLEKLRSKLRLPICDLLIKRGSSKATVEDALVQMDSIPLDETEQPTSPFGCKCWKELSHRPGEL